MEYNINLGVWQSIFAVPSVIVDQHIKLAGAAQLKVILWILRYAGHNFTVEDLAASLSMQQADIRDCIQYWVQTGVIAVNEGNIEPVQQTGTEEKAAAEKECPTENPSETPPPEPQNPSEPKETKKKRVLSRPEKPDPKYIAQRTLNDKSIEFLMHSADEIFGRITSNNDKATLLLMNEYDGLPVEVIIMLLQYAVSIGKCNMRYIEKMAITWSDEDITTLQAAENKIKQLNLGRDAAKHIQRLFGLSDRSPSEKEKTLADLWINQWQLPDELIREAYEICINNNGKYVPQYIGTTLESWYSAGVTNVSQIKREEEPDKKTHKRKKKDGYQPSYNIEEYESTSVLDEEWDD